jgi:hypothetical protein
MSQNRMSPGAGTPELGGTHNERAEQLAPEYTTASSLGTIGNIISRRAAR